MSTLRSLGFHFFGDSLMAGPLPPPPRNGPGIIFLRFPLGDSILSILSIELNA